MGLRNFQENISWEVLGSRLDSEDTMAEWLRRRMQVPLGSARAGSNPARVVIFFGLMNIF